MAKAGLGARNCNNPARLCFEQDRNPARPCFEQDRNPARLCFEQARLCFEQGRPNCGNVVAASVALPGVNLAT